MNLATVIVITILLSILIAAILIGVGFTVIALIEDGSRNGHAVSRAGRFEDFGRRALIALGGLGLLAFIILIALGIVSLWGTV